MVFAPTSKSEQLTKSRICCSRDTLSKISVRPEWLLWNEDSVVHNVWFIEGYRKRPGNVSASAEPCRSSSIWTNAKCRMQNDRFTRSSSPLARHPEVNPMSVGREAARTMDVPWWLTRIRQTSKNDWRIPTSEFRFRPESRFRPRSHGGVARPEFKQNDKPRIPKIRHRPPGVPAPSSTCRQVQHAGRLMITIVCVKLTYNYLAHRIIGVTYVVT